MGTARRHRGGGTLPCPERGIGTPVGGEQAPGLLDDQARRLALPGQVEGFEGDAVEGPVLRLALGSRQPAGLEIGRPEPRLRFRRVHRFTGMRHPVSLTTTGLPARAASRYGLVANPARPHRGQVPGGRRRGEYSEPGNLRTRGARFGIGPQGFAGRDRDVGGKGLPQAARGDGQVFGLVPLEREPLVADQDAQGELLLVEPGQLGDPVELGRRPGVPDGQDHEPELQVSGHGHDPRRARLVISIEHEAIKRRPQRFKVGPDRAGRQAFLVDFLAGVELRGGVPDQRRPRPGGERLRGGGTAIPGDHRPRPILHQLRGPRDLGWPPRHTCTSFRFAPESEVLLEERLYRAPCPLATAWCSRPTAHAGTRSSPRALRFSTMKFR